MPISKIPVLIPLLFLLHTTYAQYPFEKYPAIKYNNYKGWKLDYAASEKTGSVTYSIAIPHFFGQESLTLWAVLEGYPKCNYLKLYKGRKFVQRINVKKDFNPHDFSEPVRVADINGDGLADLKFVASYLGCGLSAMNVGVLYLFQQPGGHFAKIEYMDKTASDNTPERDMDGDGNYEIITMDLQSYKTHNYWAFNIYNFKDNTLVNVNKKFGYPILVQYLDRANYTPAGFSKSVRNTFSLKRPPEYDAQVAGK